jgi:hypothetical protein
MPRPRKQLNQYQSEITTLLQEGNTVDQILYELINTHSCLISKRTLERALKAWGVYKQTRTDDTPELRAKIHQYFFEFNLPDRFIIRRLEQDGFLISSRGLHRIRLEMGLFRRSNSEQQENAAYRARLFFQQEQQRSTILQSYGRGYLYTYMRQNYHCISRTLLYDVYREFAPENLRERFGKPHILRQPFRVPGPDWIWSIDGHDKLKEWGIEIYGAIDAYSRFCPWFYCGISNSTSQSIVLQYLSVLKQRKTMPARLRADHGSETALIALIHYFLSSTRVKYNDTERQHLTFDDCFFYGRSVHNTRIESWWGQLSNGRLQLWRVSNLY